MKKIFFAIFIGCAALACNNADKPSDKTGPAKDALMPLVKAMQKQVELFPDSAGLRLQYAFLLDSIDMHKQALIQMDTLVKKDSTNYGLMFARGEIAENAGDTLLALESYAAAASIYESPDALLALANIYAEMKNNRAVLICSRIKAMGLGREYDAHCAFIMGVYNARQHKAAEAVKYFDECIANNYTYMEAYIEKGLVYFDAKQYDKALQVFQFAASVNNLYADAYYYQARNYEMLNKKDSAVLRFKQALQLDPTLTQAKERLDKLEK